MKVLNIFRKLVFSALVFVALCGAARAASFSDVSLAHANAAAIDFLTKEGVIAGYPDGSFRPENPVNRAEALKILLLASGITAQTTPQNEFPDVSDEAWFAPFVASARVRGIAGGYPDGFFRPEQTVNLVESLKMLFTTNKISLENYETKTKLFADSEKSAWYNDFLLYAKTFEIVEADPTNQVFPATSLTRGQLAEIVYRFRLRAERICPRLLENTKTFPATYFREVSLTSELPNIFYENEAFGLAGSTTESAENVTVVFENRESKKHTQFSAKVEANNFSLAPEFRTPGHYNFSVIPSTTDRNTAAIIEVLPRECAPATVESVGGNPPANLQTSLQENKPTVSWDSGENNLFRVVIRQGDNRFERLISAGQSTFSLDPADFESFKLGDATLQIFGAKSEHGWSYEPRTQWLGSSILTLNLSQHHFSTFDEERLVLPSLPVYRGPRISFTGTAKSDIEPDVYLINPRGRVEAISILENAEKIPAGSPFVLNLQLPEIGTYILEINATDGIAVLNHPLYLPNEFPLIPDFADLREASSPDQKISLNREKAIWLRLVNEFRAQQQLPKVDLDAGLTEFAQKYAERMVIENFFGHVDLAGNSPDTRRKLAGLQLPVGENLARDSKTEYAHSGLLRSAAHRANIVAPEWTRVGLGIAKDAEGRMIFVQEFSADPLTSQNINEFKLHLHELINAVRRERSAPEFILDGQLDSAAQNWSEKMVAEDFLNFTKSNESLENTIRTTGYAGSFTTFIAFASQLSQLVDNLDDGIFTDGGKERVAIGLAQGLDGGFRATLVFR